MPTTAPSQHARISTDNHVVVERVNGQSVVVSDLGRAPLKLLCPARRGPAAWIYTSSFGGGLVAGDEIALNLSVGENSQAVFTTQASTKVYHARRGGPAIQRLRANVAADGLLVVWPDFITLFEDARYEQHQHFNLDPTANLVLLDILTCGRLAMGERWAFESYFSRNTVDIDGQPAVIEALSLNRNDAPLTHPLRGGRFNAMATLHLVGPKLAEHTQAITDHWLRAALPERQADLLLAASPTDHGAMLRLAATDTETLVHQLQDLATPLFQQLNFDPWSRKW